MRVMTMCQSAELAWRSPPRLRRWRSFLPLLASSGETPQRWAKVASLRSRWGLSPAATSRAVATSVPTPLTATSPGGGLRGEGLQHGVDLGHFGFERDGAPGE